MTAHADRPWSTSAAGHARQRTDSSRCWGFGSLLRRIATIAAAVATLHHGRGLCATPVISHQHVYEEDVGAVPYAVTGDGIHFAQTGVVATFYIDVLDDTATQELVSSRGTRFLYVWIANEEQVLVAQVRHVGGNIFSAEYKSNFPGIYRVHIENVDTSQRRETVVEPVVGSPFNLEISGEVTLDISNLPSCTEDDYYNLKKLPGTWISSALAPKPENVLRSGWVFQPEECNWDVLSPAELRALTGEWGRQLKGSGNDMWMLISGSSVQRGVYLALVDLILSTTMKDGMTDSPLAKCWGYAEVSIGSLRVSYQDFRTVYFRDPEADNFMECHDNVLATNSLLSVNATKWVDNFLFADSNPPPDLFVGEHLRNLSPWKKLVYDRIPHTWKGKVVLLHGMHAPLFPRDYPPFDVQLDYDEFFADDVADFEAFFAQDIRMNILPIQNLDSAMLHQHEAEGCYGCSQHMHAFCKKWQHTGHMRPEGQRLCGDTIEMIAQILLSMLVAHRGGRHSASVSAPLVHSAADLSESFTLSLDCPADLLPFHITIPHPAVHSIASFLEWPEASPPQQKVWTLPCPSTCLASEPNGVIDTQSGPVLRRICPSSV